MEKETKKNTHILSNIWMIVHQIHVKAEKFEAEIKDWNENHSESPAGDTDQENEVVNRGISDPQIR